MTQHSWHKPRIIQVGARNLATVAALTRLALLMIGQRRLTANPDANRHSTGAPGGF